MVTTPIYGIALPVPGGDEDAWAPILNDAIVALEAKVASGVLSFYVSGLPDDADDPFVVDIPITAENTFTLPAGAAGSSVIANDAATAPTTFQISDGTSNVGTMSWAAAGAVPTISVAAPVAFTVGKRFRLTRPLPPDATLDRIGFTIAGQRIGA